MLIVRFPARCLGPGPGPGAPGPDRSKAGVMSFALHAAWSCTFIMRLKCPSMLPLPWPDGKKHIVTTWADPPL